MMNDRARRYRDAIWGEATTNAAAHAVMAVADAEQAELLAKVERVEELIRSAANISDRLNKYAVQAALDGPAPLVRSVETHD